MAKLKRALMTALAIPARRERDHRFLWYIYHHI